MLRLLFLTVSRLRGQGGKEAALEMVSRGLAGRGHVVSVAFVGPCEDRTWEARLPNLRVGAMPMAWRAAREHPVVAMTLIADAVRAVRPDAVMVTEPGGAILLRSACAIGRLPRPRVVSWLHGDVARNSFSQGLRWCDGHLAISRGIGEQLRAVARPGSPVDVVFNPIRDPGGPIPRPGDGSAVFVFCGRIEPQKRVDRLLRILALIKGLPWRLEMVGDGALCGDMERLAEDLGIAGRITWHGWQADPWTRVSEATAFLMTSDSEGFPLVLLEAGARGIPAVAMDCRFGPSEIIEPGRNGWLVPLGADAEFQAVLRGICEGSVVMPPQQAVCAPVARYRLQAVLDAIEDALERVTGPTIAGRGTA